jgi:hypothetical protein
MVDETRSGGIGRAFRTYVDIVLFRKGPEDLPVSQALLILTIVANVLLTLALSAALPLPEYNRVAVAGLGVAFVTAWYWALLRLAGRPERFLQTTSAVFGFEIMLLPAYGLVRLLFPDAQSPMTLRVPVLLLGATIEIWTLAVNSRILRSATQWSLPICVAVVLIQALTHLMLISTLYPNAVGMSGEATAAGAGN